MKQNTNNSRRSRGRNANRGRGSRLTVVQDGQIILDGKTRGQLTQSYDKYLNLAREAQAGGDRIAAEGYFQHAEHYYRMLSLLNEAMRQSQDTGSEGEEAAEVELETSEAENASEEDTGEEEPEIILAAS